MIDYDRRITYVDKYSGDIKVGNGGYIKTQIRGGIGTLRIEFDENELKSNGYRALKPNPVQIGYFIWSPTQENKILACAFCEKDIQEEMPWVFEFNPENMAKLKYSQISGVVVKHNKSLYLADWTKKSGMNQIYGIEWKNSLITEINENHESAKALESPDEVLEKETQTIPDIIPEETVSAQSIPDFLYTKKKEKKSNVHYDKSYYMKINDWKDLFKKYDIVDKFNDDLIYDVIQIGYDDLKYLPKPCERLVNNSFLLHGLFNYGHVILGKYKCKKKNKVYIIGIPGVTNASERTMAPMFGFEHFKLARRSANEEIDFGYWYRLFTD